MNVFTISQLEQYSGIKAHTLRIWEKRYNALQPSRSEGNTRYYDGNQLRRLLNIVGLKNSEYKIHALCKMSDEQLFDLLAQKNSALVESETNAEYFITQLIAAGINLDELAFTKLFEKAVLSFGFQGVYQAIVYPILIRLGLLWSSNAISPGHEHFISNLLRQKLFAEINALPQKRKPEKTWLLFLPENEWHELGLLYSKYLLLKSGMGVIYLGSNVPLETLKELSKQSEISHLLFFVVHNMDALEFDSYFKTLENIFPKSAIKFSANENLLDKQKTKYKSNILETISDLEKLL